MSGLSLLSVVRRFGRRVPWRRIAVFTVRAGAGVTVGSVALAEVLGRAAGWGAFGPGDRDGPRVAVTFDDGPGERTAALLDVLARHGVKATFYVTRPAVRAHAVAFQAILDAGHQVEAHGRWHRHALTLWPWQEWAQVAWHPRSAGRRPERRLGRRARRRLRNWAAPAGDMPAMEAPLQYRPPFGGHSPFTRLFAALLERQVALWDVEGRDWTAGSEWTPADAARLARETLERVRPGSVILLHDGPAVTPALLDEVLRGVQARGLQAVRVNELPMRRIGWRAAFARLPRSYGR